ncbi:FAD binding domain-containing protein [Psychromicrobium xiongbiense]|uniref:FAD binding domain-containing protein n=1 Tax=Psychromicrobium xiongbiense TaxID=3051184 RepID=UPI00255278D9|nr:FAD binding domain-containing protein [Psychromicrobium sp. YIM S02556]
MDLNRVTTLRQPRSRSELTLSEGEALLAGGSWLFSEPQPKVTGLVDLLALGWPPVEPLDEGLRLAATCTLAELAALPAAIDWKAHPLFKQCCSALLGSFKVWNVATMGGNLCLALPAGPMAALVSALDATAVIWTPDGGERELPAAELVTGVGRTALAPGEVLRAIDIPVHALRSRTAYRKISLRPVGRSAALVIGRLGEDNSFTLTVTAATRRPHHFTFDGLPGESAVLDAVDGIDDWYDDPHGAPDWRRAMTLQLSAEVRNELAPDATYPTERAQA